MLELFDHYLPQLVNNQNGGGLCFIHLIGSVSQMAEKWLKSVLWRRVNI
jgi:hypothetical protein